MTIFADPFCSAQRTVMENNGELQIDGSTNNEGSTGSVLCADIDIPCCPCLGPCLASVGRCLGFFHPVEFIRTGLEKYAIFCAPALHFADTMSDFAAVAEFGLIKNNWTYQQCSYVQYLLTCGHFLCVLRDDNVLFQRY